MELKIIAKIESGFKTKFGIPRQSGLIENTSRVVFEPDYRNVEALRGLETFSHVWLIWGFSENEAEGWSPTVRPPRLGGNVRVGVFASRSPYRPNALGLSAVKLCKIEDGKHGKVLVVSGADLMDGTPVYDIKPYLPLTDCRVDAVDGFAADVKDYSLTVVIPESIQTSLPEDVVVDLMGLLAQDPRPAYQNDVERVYGFVYGGYEIKFVVDDGVLTVKSAEKEKGE